MDNRRWPPVLMVAMILAVQPKISVADSIGSAVAAKNEVQGVVGGSTQNISSGSQVYSNELVRTGQGGVADLEFLDKTNLSVGPVSEIRLDKFVYDPAKAHGTVAIKATRGAFRFVTGVQDHNSYEIKTPYATLGVRGTKLEVRLENKGAFYATTVSGKKVEVTDPNTVLTVCSNGTFGTQANVSNSILNFSSAAAAGLDASTVAGLAAAAAAGLGGVAGTVVSGQTPPPQLPMSPN